jgi:hypothetical protein
MIFAALAGTALNNMLVTHSFIHVKREMSEVMSSFDNGINARMN